jgi:hypothetical protein
MKTTYKKLFSILLFTAVFAFANVANADSKFLNKDLALSFPTFDFFNFGSSKEEVATTTAELVESETLAIVQSAKDSCEHFDATSNNLLILESASADARQKIENVEETIDAEVSVRENIFDSVKGLLGLQKKDKVIFREMKKDIGDAKVYYDDLDLTVASTTNYLNENSCENVKTKEAKKVDEETEDLVQDESTFRKQFAGSLKEKMKILQTGVKEAKK